MQVTVSNNSRYNGKATLAHYHPTYRYGYKDISFRVIFFCFRLAETLGVLNPNKPL